jgi:hypothetical protein
MLDTEGGIIKFHRVEYDFTTTQHQMREVGLPIALIRRLSFGL